MLIFEGVLHHPPIFWHHQGGHVWKVFFRHPLCVSFCFWAEMWMNLAHTSSKGSKLFLPIYNRQSPLAAYGGPWSDKTDLGVAFFAAVFLANTSCNNCFFRCFLTDGTWQFCPGSLECCFWGAPAITIATWDRHGESQWTHIQLLWELWGTGHKRRARGHRLGCCNSRCNSRPWTQHMQSDKQPNKVDRWRHKVRFFPRGWHVHNPISLIREDWWNMCAIDCHCTFLFSWGNLQNHGSSPAGTL